MRKKAKYGQLGSVSSGTMRAEDVLPALLREAGEIQMSKEDRAAVREIQDRKYSKDDSEEKDEDLNELFDLLGNYAPPYCYFGAHEGDGADYGFWASWDALGEAVREGEVLRHATNGMVDSYDCGSASWVTGDAPLRGLGYRYVLSISDHGNVTLRHRNGRKVWGVA